MLEKIIGLLPSEALKRKICEVDFKFSEKDLLQIIYRYSKTFDERISLLREYSGIVSEETAECVKTYIEFEQSSFKSFSEDLRDCIFELHIKDTPQSYDKRYICLDYVSALSFIDLYNKEYEEIKEPASDKTRYTVIKRHIFSDKTGEGFSEDECGKCVLGKDKTLISVSDYVTFQKFFSCNDLCDSCGQTCPRRTDKVLYPRFLRCYDLVKYTDNEGAVRYGVYSAYYDSVPADYVNLIPLDSEAVYYHRLDKDFNDNVHIEAPLAEPVSPRILDEKMKADYAAVKKYIHDNP